MAIEKSWKPEWVVRAGSGAGEPVAEIGRATRHEEMPDVWFCPVSMPSLFETEKPIAGVDAEQAYELAVQFVKLALLNNGSGSAELEIERFSKDKPQA